MTSMPSGIVTLTFGGFANHVGAHYWNIQDDAHGGDDGTEALVVDVDWRVEYAERERGAGANASYVPRVVMFDLCGSARVGLGAEGGGSTTSRDAETASTTSWDGRVEVCRAPLANRSAFAHALDRESRAVQAAATVNEVQTRSVFDEDEDERDGRSRSKLGAVGRALDVGRSASSPSSMANTDQGIVDNADDIARALVAGACQLDEDARHWSDFLKAEVHERKSCFALAGKWTDIDAFSGFGEGLDWISTEDRREDIRESIRYWAEDCDVLGGFHIACDDSSGFGGVCAQAMEDIKDDYDGAPICVFSVNAPRIHAQHGERRMDMLNAAFASTVLADNADLYCPLAAFDDGCQSRFRASAACALAMETITTPWRLKKSTTTTTSSVGGMSLHEMARHMTNRAPGSRVSARVSAPTPDAADVDAFFTSFQSATPNEFIPRKRTHGNDNDDDDADLRPFAESFVFRGVVDDIAWSSSSFDAAFARELHRCPRARCASRAPVAIPLPFPKLFGHRDVTNIPISTRLTSGESSARVLLAIESDARRASRSAAGKAALRAWSADAVEFEEMCENLLTQARAFAGEDDE